MSSFALFLFAFTLHSCLPLHASFPNTTTTPAGPLPEQWRRPMPPHRPPRPPLPVLPGPLLQRRPRTNPGPLSNRNLILFITRELKRNITSDPLRYTVSWVGNNYCLFRGYYCETVPDRNITGLVGIDFNGARFGGNLNFYRYIRFLPDISFFHVNSNNFSGVIFPNLNKLRYFSELDLSNNGFSGRFPVSIIGASRLSFIDIRFNTYAGTVPRQIFDVDTDVLFINNNGFSQTIPANFGNTMARFITLANNRFTGPIPRSIGRAWTTLTEVLFLNNQLTGCLPYEIGFLNQATVFDVGTNRLTGPIPQSFGCLTSMQLLNLAHNRFYGRIPESLCRLRYAVNFTLSYNYFTQIGPACRRLVTAGKLNVRRNCISGFPNQRSAANCALFFSKSKSCPRQNTFGIVPCTLPPATLLKETEVPSDEVVAPAPSVTYAALVKPPH
ncbi:uncharacterized protein At4g06744-like [Malania oleifera]|uniref:uncharacterized protein At4g06744-like n=1 Tax=Malania oleifera TaxID=397392 RepID=UPI0025AE9B54|nr:uncharacterized protein At4g06744-like [Malania oleifera]